MYNISKKLMFILLFCSLTSSCFGLQKWFADQWNALLGIKKQVELPEANLGEIEARKKAEVEKKKLGEEAKKKEDAEKKKLEEKEREALAKEFAEKLKKAGARGDAELKEALKLKKQQEEVEGKKKQDEEKKKQEKAAKKREEEKQRTTKKRVSEIERLKQIGKTKQEEIAEILKIQAAISELFEKQSNKSNERSKLIESLNVKLSSRFNFTKKFPQSSRVMLMHICPDKKEIRTVSEVMDILQKVVLCVDANTIDLLFDLSDWISYFNYEENSLNTQPLDKLSKIKKFVQQTKEQVEKRLATYDTILKRVRIEIEYLINYGKNLDKYYSDWIKNKGVIKGNEPKTLCNKVAESYKEFNHSLSDLTRDRGLDILITQKGEVRKIKATMAQLEALDKRFANLLPRQAPSNWVTRLFGKKELDAPITSTAEERSMYLLKRIEAYFEIMQNTGKMKTSWMFDYEQVAKMGKIYVYVQKLQQELSKKREELPVLYKKISQFLKQDCLVNPKVDLKKIIEAKNERLGVRLDIINQKSKIEEWLNPREAQFEEYEKEVLRLVNLALKGENVEVAVIAADEPKSVAERKQLFIDVKNLIKSIKQLPKKERAKEYNQKQPLEDSSIKGRLIGTSGKSFKGEAGLASITNAMPLDWFIYKIEAYNDGLDREINEMEKIVAFWKNEKTTKKITRLNSTIVNYLVAAEEWELNYLKADLYEVQYALESFYEEYQGYMKQPGSVVAK